MAQKSAFQSKSAFELLSVDQPSSDEDDGLPSPSAPQTPAGTPSKKAAARQRAKLRKKSSQQTLAEQASDAVQAIPAQVSAAVGSAAKAAGQPMSHLNATVAALESVTAPRAAAAGDATQKAASSTKAVAQTTTAKVVEAASTAATSAAQAASIVGSAVSAAIPEGATSLPAINFPDGPSAFDDGASSSDEGEPPVYDSDDESDVDESSKQPLAQVASPPKVASPKVEAYTGADHDPGKKKAAIVTRTLWGLVMAGGAIGLVALGHIYTIVLILAVQAVVFGELTSLFDAGYAHEGTSDKNGTSAVSRERRGKRREERDRWSRRMSWYFFAATNYFLYGESLIYYFKHILTLRASFLPTAYSFAQHHRLISFGLYIIGFVSFVANLKRASLRRQFGLFGWIHMSLLLIVVSSHFIVNNILEGMIWFWVPASLVIFNDVAAYVCGMLFGRHQLIKLSPKKTVEGFVGAFFVTILLAVGWSTLFMKSSYMICPVQDLATNALSQTSCTPNSVFVYRDFNLPQWAITALEQVTTRHITSIPWAPFQLHSIVLAIFASLVAPFGGFFASGFKRAFNIKDFGASIPGHGGMTDRMDCQFLMGLFTYVYYASLIRDTHVTVGSVLATIVTALSTAEQLELYAELTKHLASKGIKAATPF